MLLMSKSTISMAIFNSYVSLPEGMYPRKKLELHFQELLECRDYHTSPSCLIVKNHSFMQRAPQLLSSTPMKLSNSSHIPCIYIYIPYVPYPMCSMVLEYLPTFALTQNRPVL